jgi:GT2 family glycosyltransferase
MTELTWALTIATKDRIDILKTCVELALTQTRPPVEVVVADSSADWEQNADVIRNIIVRLRPDTRIVYQKGDAPSLTVQRNQAVAQTTADILFMIDDDSLMMPDCAEAIMQIYEADTAGKVAGIQASETPHVPGKDVTGAQKKNVDLTQSRKKSLGLKWLQSRVLMMSKTEVFIPYDKTYHSGGEGSVPPELAGFALVLATLFGGFRMTYRRAAALAEPFDATLRYYCPGEDLDGSYRISRHGLLLTSYGGKLHHFVSASGRLNRGQVAHLWSLNQAVLLRRHARDQSWARRRYNLKMAHRVFADLLKDVLMRRFNLAQTRGSMRAWRNSRDVWSQSPEGLEKWYPARQEQIVKAQ